MPAVVLDCFALLQLLFPPSYLFHLKAVYICKETPLEVRSSPGGVA